MLYPQNNSKTLTENLFRNPTSEYRGTPFWAWNCKLNKEMLERQIMCFKKMGLGGFHMHSRTGMSTEYLSDEFMDLVKFCVKKAESENMLAWLYDEDRWPSGAAGGLVTKDPAYRARKLAFTPSPIDHCVSKEEGIKTGKPYLLGCFDIALDTEGNLKNYEKIDEKQSAKSDKWYAYVVTNSTCPWYNNETYVNTLSKNAIDKFIEITYESYKKAVGDKFGTVVPAIFTDEPQFERKTYLNFNKDKTEIFLPWSDDIPDTYKKTYGSDIIQTLPELFWELSDQPVSQARYLFHDHIAERFASAFADSCGNWCEENGIMFTGHMLAEPTLKSQTSALGDAMRSYRSFQLPGIDMLCNYVEFTTAKQAQSAVHQYGREGMLSELYGVTNWDFDFRGHKFQGDWQAALGVSVRVHHLSWVSMEGESKRDYPASISYQSPWHEQYSYIEDHFARVNTALTRGRPVVKVGVIHPVESYWLHWGSLESTGGIREQMDHNFKNITEWLLLGQIDFDFICESLLPEQCENATYPLTVGKMQYETILVPDCETLRQSTFDTLTAFQKAGGKLIFAGKKPKYLDACPTDRIDSLYNRSEKISFDKESMLSALKKDRVIEIRNADGTLTDNLIYNMREEEGCNWLFIAQGKNTVHVDAVLPQKIILKIKGEFTPILYNTLTGDITDIDYDLSHGNTIINTKLHCHDSLLLKLDRKSQSARITITEKEKSFMSIDFKNKVNYTRSEPNVLLLDTAQYKFDEEEFCPEEEILKVDNLFRAKLGWPSRQVHVAQPWTIEEETIEHYITLKFTIKSEITVQNPSLAIENAKNIKITLNENNVESKVVGYYVDESIQTVSLPPLEKGRNILTVTLPFGKRTNTEYCYILGEFNVKVEGFVKTITPPTDTIGFSSITNQGMPFYGGNITYFTDIETPECTLKIKANNYKGALIRVSIDEKDAGIIAFAPYTLSIKNVSAGRHNLTFTLFGNRYNTFGALHNADTANQWHGPHSWRTTGDTWCYEYKLKDTGILASPVIEICK